MAGELDQASVLYNALERRRTSRFLLPGGRCLARFWLASSKQFPGDFLERRKRTALGTYPERVAIMEYPTWVPRMSSDNHNYGSRRFYVLLSTDSRQRSRILGTDVEVGSDLARMDVPEGCRIQAVPLELHQKYQEDLHGAIRDFSGHATVARNPFIEDPDVYRGCVGLDALGDVPREHPFRDLEPVGTSVQSVVPDRFLRVRLDHAGREYDPGRDHRRDDEFAHYPTLNPGARRFLHVDLGRTQDGAAFCCGHFAGYKRMVAHDVVDGQVFQYVEERPVTIVDFMCRVYAPRGGKVEPAAIRTLIQACLSYSGVRDVGFLSYDGWQSFESLDAWQAAGIRSDVLSVDRDDRAYGLLRQSLVDRRTSYYEYEPLFQDLSSLERDNVTGKIDHTGTRDDGTPGTKDVSDSLAGVHQHVEDHHATRRLPLPIRVGDLIDDPTDPRRAFLLRESEFYRSTGGGDSATDGPDPFRGYDDD